ncbi:MAG: pyridoxamine 5'-phosphate oxidase [Calditrichaeota bacterium]|nr:MAG: pyridoxamine 5'-phosphate oxidase [Calditrichota bacterium]
MMQEKITENDPLLLFSKWFEAAQKTEIDPTPMTLATTGADGRPSARVVLLKGFDKSGFVFYTNLNSRKSADLRHNPRAALCFFWPTLLKQVRIEGEASLVSDQEADAYFATRPRERQLAAWASQQSAILESRERLYAKYREYEEKFAGKTIPRPPFWSGYRVTPCLFEFWIGHENRLNERILFTREDKGWKRQLLYP